jgi:hypothetical protein
MCTQTTVGKVANPQHEIQTIHNIRGCISGGHFHNQLWIVVQELAHAGDNTDSKRRMDADAQRAPERRRSRPRP